MKKCLIAYFLVILSIFVYATDSQRGIDQIVNKLINIASSVHFKDKEDMLQLVLLRWDKNRSEYKIVLTHPLTDWVIKGKNILDDNNYIKYDGKYNENILSIKLQCFDKYGNNYIKKYEICTRILIQKDPIYILGWSAYTSDKRSMPEFICFVKNIRSITS